MLIRSALFVGLAVATTQAFGDDNVTFTIDISKSTAVSPYVYGVNFPDWKTQKNIPFTRFGGNRITAYNWETNASNAGSDWQHQNDSLMGKTDEAGKCMVDSIENAQKNGAAIVISIPTIGYVAADKKGDGDVNKTPEYLKTRFKESVAKKGAAFTDKPDASDDKVFQDECVAFLEKQFPEAHKDAAKSVFYALDNEPDLWSHTHARIHPKAITYDELVKNNVEYATAIKDVAPKAMVFGFVSYGYNGFTTLQNAPDGKGRNVLDVYLAGMAEAEKKAGKRLIDVLDLHWYPEAYGDKKRVIDDGASAGLAKARVQSPRSLWDPTFKEESWIVGANGGKAIALIPMLKEKIARHYPGTKLAFTEYYYGGGDDISGAIAQADVLGIFGREGVFAAALWHVGNSKDTFIKAAFDSFRSFDGKGAMVGDKSLVAVTSNVEASSVYAFGGGGGMQIVAINKSDQVLHATIKVKAAGTKATAWTLTSEGGKPKRASSEAVLAADGIKIDLPAMSVVTVAVK
jgi:hypothetical protein